MRCLHCGSRLALLAATWLLSGLICAPALGQGYAVVQRTALAGYTFHAAPRLWPQLHEGDALQLVREADNAFDALAVRVDWQGQTLGYLPREINAAVARALDRHEALGARIARLRDHPNPRLRIEIEITLPLAPAPS